MDPSTKRSYVRKGQIGVFGGVAAFVILPFVFRLISFPHYGAFLVGLALFVWGGCMLALSKGRSPFWGVLGVTLVGIGFIDTLKDKEVLDEWSKVKAKINYKARFIGLIFMFSQIPIFIFSVNMFRDGSTGVGFNNFLKTTGVFFGLFLLVMGLFSYLINCPWCKKRSSLMKSNQGNYYTCEHCKNNWRY